jgi:adenosine deaminase
VQTCQEQNEDRDMSQRQLRGLPKAHLHLHLEAAQRPALLQELAQRYELPTPSPGDGTFATFLRAAAIVFSAPRSADDYMRLFREMAEDGAAEGAVWLEPAAWIRPTQPERMGLPDTEAVLQLLLDCAREAERQTGVGIGLMVSTSRMRPPAEAEDLARLASRYAGRGVVSFGLADDEANGPAEPFANAFSIARAAGLISAPHGGEHAGPESVRAALDALGARRIQHGVRSIEDSDLVKRLADEGVCLDVCPTSNVQLSVAASLEEHPLPALMAAGVTTSLNADDPVIFGCGLLDEYELARRAFGFDDRVLAKIAADSIRASGAPEEVRRRGLAGIEAWLDGGAPAGPSKRG